MLQYENIAHFVNRKISHVLKQRTVNVKVLETKFRSQLLKNINTVLNKMCS